MYPYLKKLNKSYFLMLFGIIWLQIKNNFFFNKKHIFGVSEYMLFINPNIFFP